MSPFRNCAALVDWSTLGFRHLAAAYHNESALHLLAETVSLYGTLDWTVGGKLCYHRNEITHNYSSSVNSYTSTAEYYILPAQRPVSLRVGRVQCAFSSSHAVALATIFH